MLITISGTPGTGKTAIAKILAKRTSAKLITTGYLVKKYRIKTSPDRKRGTKIIDVKKLAKAARKESKLHETMIFEGHLSHFAKSDVNIILRASPQELEKRLKRKGWSAKKIRENVEAEAIGVISSESRGLEIDTTKKNPGHVADAIIKLLNYHRQKRYVKKIDWTKEYRIFLIKNQRKMGSRRRTKRLQDQKYLAKR